MNIKIYNSFVLFLLSSILLNDCSQKNNNIDLSNLPVIKQKEVVSKNETETEAETENLTSTKNEFIKDLVPLRDKKQVLSKFKFGKKDPFSQGDTQLNDFSTNFVLTGFLNTDGEKYVFVKYLGNEGIISQDSIGGLNTEFLPAGAKVINIDTKRRQLKINLDNEDFIFEL